MKLTWNAQEVDQEETTNQKSLEYGTAVLKKNPQSYVRHGSRSKTPGRSKIRGDVSGKNNMDSQHAKYVQEREEYEDFVDQYYDYAKMMVDGNQNLMSFLNNPEADEQLVDIEHQDDQELSKTISPDMQMTPVLTRSNSQEKIRSFAAIPNLNQNKPTFDNLDQ